MTPDRIEEHAPRRRIVGARGVYSRQTRSGIPDQWAEWEYHKLTRVVGDLVFGVCYGFEGENFVYLCGLEVEEHAPIPSGQADVILPAGPYAVYVHRGHVSGIAGLFDAVCKGVVIPGWQLAPGPQVEVYTEEFDPLTASGVVELWFPVTRLS